MMGARSPKSSKATCRKATADRRDMITGKSCLCASWRNCPIHHFMWLVRIVRSKCRGECLPELAFHRETNVEAVSGGQRYHARLGTRRSFDTPGGQRIGIPQRIVSVARAECLVDQIGQ